MNQSYIYLQTSPLHYKPTDDETQAKHSDDTFPSFQFQGIKNDEFPPELLPPETAETTNKPTIVLPEPPTSPGDCNLSTYITSHATYYSGDDSFLSPPTERTLQALTKLNELLQSEREKGGVLSVDNTTPSTITSHKPGYLLSSTQDVIYGLQAEEPLMRTCKPKGGYGVVKKALEGYGYEVGEGLKVYEKEVCTHNDLVFGIYTEEVSYHVVVFV